MASLKVDITNGIEELKDNEVIYGTFSRPLIASEIKEHDDRENATSPVVLISLIVSVGVAFTVVSFLFPTDIFDTSHLDILPYICQILCSLFILIISCAYILWYMLTKNRHRLEESMQERSESRLKCLTHCLKSFFIYIFTRCPSLLEILVLCGGSLLACTLDIVDRDPDTSIELPKTITYLFSLTVQMCFFSIFMYNDKIQLPAWSKFALPVIISAQICLCVTEIAEPLLASTNQSTWKDSGCTENANGTESIDLFKFLKNFAKPFQVKFTTIAVTILSGMWIAVNKIRASTFFKELEETVSSGDTNSNYPDNSKATAETSLRIHRKSNKTLKCQMFGMLAMAFSYTTLSTIVLNYCEKERNQCKKENEFVCILLSRGIMLLYIGVILTGLTVYSLRYIKVQNPTVNQRGAVSQYIVLITGTVAFTYYAICIIAAGVEVNQDIAAMDITNNSHRIQAAEIKESERIGAECVLFIYPLVMLLQIWTQTHLLLEAQRRHVKQRSIQVCVMYIIGLNLAVWLQMGINLGFQGIGDSSKINFLSKSGVVALDWVIYPFFMLYRFHSAVVAWEIVIEGLQNKKEHTSSLPTG